MDAKDDPRRAFQGVMVLAGIALIVAGWNGSRPLVIAGGALIFLAVMSRLRGIRPPE